MADKNFLQPGDGFAVITLKSGATLRMREPTVEDQLAIDKVKDGDAAKELSLFANLCEITPAELCKLTLRDYRRVQAAFASFID